MKKTKILLIITLLLVTFTACNKETKHNYSKEFKEDYESLNGKTDKDGNEYRTVSISNKNVFVETNIKEIVKMIENKETFYVYFGSRLSPWCRSVIQKADEISRANDVEKIYYVDIWDDEENELFRDKYELNENNELVRIKEGTEEYKYLIELFKDYLIDYTLTDSNGNTINVGEKRIDAPNFMYINKGKVNRLIDGKSTLQNDSLEELTEQILKDEEKKFDNFFVNICDDSC